MVLALCIPLRLFYHLEDFITTNHLEVMGKILLATGMMTCYGYFSEQFMSWYGDNNPTGFNVEHYLYVNRGTGFHQYAIVYWSLIFCNAVAIQILWFKRIRRNPLVLLLVSYIVLIGMWLERYMIITTSLSRDFLPSSWGMFSPTFWDFAVYIGTIGMFFLLFLLFIRLLPMISISEMRALLPGTHAREEGR
jgi:molybdopterin-containing oxidoreductase family membrane subunit